MITKTFNFSTAADGRVATLLCERENIKAEWVSRKLSDLPTWRWLESPPIYLMF
jgi:hypothetical protein